MTAAACSLKPRSTIDFSPRPPTLICAVINRIVPLTATAFTHLEKLLAKKLSLPFLIGLRPHLHHHLFSAAHDLHLRHARAGHPMQIVAQPVACMPRSKLPVLQHPHILRMHRRRRKRPSLVWAPVQPIRCNLYRRIIPVICANQMMARAGMIHWLQQDDVASGGLLRSPLQEQLG